MDLIFTLSSWWNMIFGGPLGDIASLFNSSMNDLLQQIFGTVDQTSPLITQTIYNVVKTVMSLIKIGGVPMFDISLFSLMFSGGVVAFIIFSIFKYLLDIAE